MIVVVVVVIQADILMFAGLTGDMLTYVDGVFFFKWGCIR